MCGLILLLVFVPTFTYVGVLWWLDRYEKEPFMLLAAAFVWGGVPAIILALILEVVLDIPITAFSPSPFMYDLLGSAASAPLVEELVKGIALLLLVIFWRREIDSPLDGLVYGGMVGFGFAAVENVFYLLSASEEGGLNATLSLAFMRVVLFGLNHAMYTGFTGLGLALALEARRAWKRVLLPMVGFTVSVLVHAAHNAFTTIYSYNEGVLLLCTAVGIDWAGVAVLLGVIAWTLYMEKQRVAHYLKSAVPAGLVAEHDVPIVGSPWKRMGARLTALLGGDVKRWRTLGRYYHLVTEAAFNAHRVQQGDTKSQPRLAQAEKDLRDMHADVE